MNESSLHLQFHTMMLRVKNLERSLEWYEQKLGMKVSHRDVQYKLVSLEGQTNNRITLWELREGERPTVTTPDTAYAVFVSSNARSDYRTLKARGVDATEPEDTGLGLRFFWVTDPDGYRQCILEFLPE